MVDQDNELEGMECVLNDTTVEPIRLSYAFLSRVTDNFSEIIGSGGFGTVYKGVVRNWKLAVKKLSENHDFSDEQFEQELECLIRVKHKNIVRFLGYCSDTQREMLQHNGRYILADIRRRLLCFEYAPNKSLRDYLRDESHRGEWDDKRYQIIEGICQGLRYLHTEEHIIHLDLKPDNILLDKDMVPKITDFGLSRRFSGEYSRIITQKIHGTLGYTAPECLINGEISFKADIFSLGVIIKQLLIGSTNLSDFDEWYQSLDNEDIYYPKVKRCVTIAQLCVNNEPRRRPTIDCIIGMLVAQETMIEMGPLDFGNLRDSSRSTLGQVGSDSSQLPRTSSENIETSSEVILSPVSRVSSNDMQPMGASAAPSHLQKREMSIEVISEEVQPMGVSAAPPQLRITSMEHRESSSIVISPSRSSDASELLDVYPSELHFLFMPNKRMKCQVSLTNRTDHCVGFWIIPTELDTRVCFYFPRSPIFQMMGPHSSVVRTIIRKGQKHLLQQQCNFEVLMIVAELKHYLKNLKSSIGINQNMGTEFLNRAKKLGCQVHRTMLTSVICRPESCQPIVTREIIRTQRFGCVFSVDVHPIKTWILAGYATGFSIMNYQTEQILVELRTNRVDAVKFIDRAELFTIGYSNGYARVYTYITFVDMVHVKEFQAYHAKPVNLFAVHPTYPFLLSASNFDGSIKLWDWEKGWVCTRTFSVLAVGVLGLKFNQRDMNTFASVHTDGTAKVWNIQTSNPTATLTWGKPETKGYLFTSNHRYYLVTCGSKIYNKNNYAYIWDLEKNVCVHKLAVSSQNQIGIIACHTTLPILATRLGSGVVCLWDATTYRFDKMVPLTPAAQDNSFRVVPQHMILTGTNELTRLVVGCANEISVTKIYLPMGRADL